MSGALLGPKLFATPIGFGEQLPMRAYLKIGIHEADEILLIRAPPGLGMDRTLEEAVRRFLDFLRATRAGGILVKDLELDPMDFDGNVLKFLYEFLDAKRRGLSRVINPVAGLRAFGLALFYALIFVGGWMTLQHEVTGEVKVIRVSFIKQRLGAEKIRVFKELSEEVEVKEVARKMGVSTPTVYRHISSLRELELINEERKPTLLGKIFLLLEGEL